MGSVNEVTWNTYRWSKPEDGSGQLVVQCPRCGTEVTVRDGIGVSCSGCGAGHEMQQPPPEMPSIEFPMKP